MSCSSLYGIKKDYTGEVLYNYENSWLFSPIVGNVLSDKYLPKKFGMVQSVTGPYGVEVRSNINNILESSDNTPDQICWMLVNQQIFFTKDKECIAGSIQKFIKQNKEYYKSDEDSISVLESENIVGRFNDIANDILSLDESEHPYFVFKNSSVDDSVDNWFYEYDENDNCVDSSLKDLNKIVAGFTFIENGKIVDIVSNLDYKYE